MRASGIHVVVGARPNYMKVKVLVELLADCKLLHTGQHYSREMADDFLAHLRIRPPDRVLTPERGSQIKLISSLMVQLEEHWQAEQPELVIVVGDVNSTAAAALVASRMSLPVAHIEAGLRSRDLRMPEEVNRIVTDSCSDFLFCSEQSGVDNLAAESRADGVFFVGNTMIDCLVAMTPHISESEVLGRLELCEGAYAVCTFHRPSNVDDAARLDEILSELDKRGETFVYPVHPRVCLTRDYRNIKPIAPQLYCDFMRLVECAKFVVTDSGGLQEETTFLETPCVTFRENTERPETIERGTNVLVSAVTQINAAIESALNKRGNRIDLWDGNASERIVQTLREAL